MKKIIAIVALVATLLSAAACTSQNGTSTTTQSSTTQSSTVGTPSGTYTSADYVQILLSARDTDDISNITSLDENGELYRAYEESTYEMTDEDKAYFAFEGVLKYLEDTYAITIDPEKRMEIAENAIANAEGKTQEELDAMSNAAVLDYYQKEAGVTLSEEEITEIGEQAIEQELVNMEERMKEQMSSELEMLGLSQADLKEFAFSVSLMNTKAYGIGIFMPAEGMTETVKTACEKFVQVQQDAFETYLVDQYEIAKQAQVVVLDSGEVVLVMCENSDTILDKISSALAE